jgi:ribose transport system ATP-binding protein
VLGIGGLVGSGRSELLQAVFGLAKVARGTIRLGAYRGPASPARRWAQGAGLVSEDRQAEGLALSLSVADNLTLTKLEPCGPAGLVLPKKQRQAASRWVDSMQIKCRDAEQRVGQLSGGNQQKVALARLLHHDVDVLLLDEPTRGIDVVSKVEIYRLMDTCARQGKAVLMVSSYLPELLGVCDRVAVMFRGHLHPAKPVDRIDEHSMMMEATGTA